MRPEPHALVRFFDAAVPEAFLWDTLRCLQQSYDAADSRCRADFPREEGRDLYPQLRRAIFESSWRAVATRYPEATASAQLNESGNYYHTEVRFGRVVLTASAVPNPTTLVRDAKFRQTYARSAQLAFYFMEQQPLPVDEPLFGILLHGPDESDRALPGFVHVAFPSPDCSRYLDRIDLVARFAAQIAASATDATEIIDSEPAVRLRRPARREQHGA